jgi:hypothetical protein
MQDLNKQNPVTTAAQVAQWELVDGKMGMNSSAQQIAYEMMVLKKKYDAVNATYVGAYLLKLLHTFAWLQTAEIKLMPSSEYDDEGGSFRSISVRIENVTSVADFELPSELQEDDSSLDSDTAGDLIQAEISNDSEDSEMYACLTDHWSFDDISLKLDRSKVSHLLKASEQSGLQAFLILVPEFSHLVTSTTDQQKEVTPVSEPAIELVPS